MTIVIIAGGAGTRLWPLSTPEYPKHLLKIGATNSSMLEKTYRRAKRLSQEIYVVSEQSHFREVRSQLSELGEDRFIVEPERKGTANCIIAALVFLEGKTSPDEPIAFMHADHFIRDNKGFVHTFGVAATVSKKEQKIVLVGVEPDYPATGFGYIEKGTIYDEERYIYNVASFKEKPEFNVAQEYVKSGNFLWNCGYFVGSRAVFKSKMKQFAPNLLKSYNLLEDAKTDGFNKVYSGLKSEAIDYALIERVADLLVIPASFDWMDIGSYADLLKSVDTDENGNYLKGNIEISEVKNSFIENREVKPLSVIGIDNCVVVNTKDGIVVARIDLSQRIGDVAKKIYDRRTK